MVANSDKPEGFYIGGAGHLSGDYGIIEVDTKPKEGVEMTGMSCKNKIWDPAPTKESAISALKRQASEAKMNRIYIVKVEDDKSARANNCWSAILATGIAFFEDE